MVLQKQIKAVRAIKTMKRDASSQRQKMEIQIMKFVDHPNIVRLFEVLLNDSLILQCYITDTFLHHIDYRVFSGLVFVTGISSLNICNRDHTKKSTTVRGQ